MTQGQNKEGTRRKEDGFEAIFTISLSISKALTVANYPYWHIDLFAGSGYNHDAFCDGSPMVFLRQACKANRPIRAYFCDAVASAIDELTRRISAQRDHAKQAMSIIETQCILADNKTLLPLVIDTIRRREKRPACAIGTLLVDPNGPKAVSEILDYLQEFARSFPRIDLILNINLWALKRCLGHKRNGKAGFAWAYTINELLEKLPRNHWMIRNPSTHKGHPFTVMIGRDLKTSSNQFKDFHDVKSPIGRKIVATMAHVPDSLFDL